MQRRRKAPRWREAVSPLQGLCCGGPRYPGRRGAASLAACPGLSYSGLAGLQSRKAGRRAVPLPSRKAQAGEAASLRSCELRAASAEPEGASRKLQAASPEPGASESQPQAASCKPQKLRATSLKPHPRASAFICGSIVLDAGYWILDAGYWILDAGCWILDTGCWILDAGYWILDAGCWILDTGYWMLV